MADISEPGVPRASPGGLCRLPEATAAGRNGSLTRRHGVGAFAATRLRRMGSCFQGCTGAEFWAVRTLHRRERTLTIVKQLRSHGGNPWRTRGVST